MKSCTPNAREPHAQTRDLDFSAAHETQTKLHALYLDDIARYAPPEQRVKARACYLSLPRQLAKENTKFQYALVEKRAGARKFEGSVDWLTGSEMVPRYQGVSSATYRPHTKSCGVRPMVGGGTRPKVR